MLDKDGGDATAGGAGDEEAVLAVDRLPLHLAFGEIVVDGHGLIVEKNRQRLPLLQGVR